MGQGHRSRGLYRLLEWPAVYNRLMRLLGGPAARARIVRDFVQPRPGMRLLDIGCGTGALLEALPAGVAYAGCDVNPAYIETARQRYGTRGEFFRADVRDAIDARGPFDIVVAIALLHHLDDAEALRLLDTAARLLSPAGAFVSVDPTRHEGQPLVARALVSLDRGRCVRTPAGYRALLASRFGDVDERVLTDLLPVPYSHYAATSHSPSAR